MEKIMVSRIVAGGYLVVEPYADERYLSQRYLDWRLLRCPCGKAYEVPYWSRRTKLRRCPDCDKKVLADRQRRRRQQRRAAELRHTCEGCGTAMKPERRTRRYCSTTCRVAAFRRRGGGVESPRGRRTRQTHVNAILGVVAWNSWKFEWFRKCSGELTQGVIENGDGGEC